METLAQEIEQRDARVVELDLARLAVDGESDELAMQVFRSVHLLCQNRIGDLRPRRTGPALLVNSVMMFYE